MFKGAFNVDVLEYGCSEDGTMLQVEKFTNPLSEHLFYYEPRYHSHITKYYVSTLGERVVHN
jgi:hypothetical protein